jgi:2-polyprenyl-3-methyl-5-hydroxy-6-metoxy-1,4-benzoquinol methylase
MGESGTDNVGTDQRLWSRQRQFYDEECDAEFEIARPHNCGRLYQFLIEHKFRTGLQMLRLELAGRSVLEICCGSGMMSEKFARAGAAVTGIDFSSAAIARAQERARRYGFAARFLVGDAENLAFDDRSFDIVAVHDGLHHLDDPPRAIREMARVAREGVMILDPASAAITKLAVRLGITGEMEEAGNQIKRLVVSEVAAILREAGYGGVRWRRALMYYPHRPWHWWRWFDRAPALAAFRMAFWCGDLAFGRYGNKLSLAARRE